MPSHNPWFRLYSEMVDDEKMRLLAFEDRWHFVAILCCKNSGMLDSGDQLPLLMRKLGVKLGLQLRDLEAALLRLAEVGLIDASTAQPIAWDDRQFKSDASTSRVRAYRERMKQQGNVSVTAQDTDTDTDTEKKLESANADLSPAEPDDAIRPPAKAACPHAGIIAVYHEVLPELRQVREWNDTRKKLLQRRWSESHERQDLAWWRAYFGYVRRSRFLMGRTTGRDGRPFDCDLEWLIRPTNFAKVIEGKYEDDAA